jgi:amino acid permease
MKRNLPVLGFIIGALVPVVGYLVVFLILGQGQSFGQFSANMAGNHPNLAKVLSLSILANVIPFIYCNNKRLDLTARGIFIATMLYAVAIVLLKYVW